MLRKTAIVLAIAALLGSSGLSTAAFARGKVSRSDFGNSGAEHFALEVGRGGAVDGRYGARGPQLHGLRRPFGTNAHRDVWGHWGSYYGPMVAAPF